jgi:hypothetical protein
MDNIMQNSLHHQVTRKTNFRDKLLSACTGNQCKTTPHFATF